MRRRLIPLLALVPLLAPVAALAVATLTASPQSLTFAQRCVRTNAPQQAVTIRNEGDPEARDIRVVVSPSSMAGVFPLAGETARERLDPDESLEFRVGFRPGVAGTSSARAIVSYDGVVYATPSPTPTDTGSPSPSPSPPASPSPSPSPSPSFVPTSTSVPLVGSAIDRWADASPKAVNFGSVRVARPAPQKTVTIYDDGATPLQVSGISLAGRHRGDFTVSERGPVTVTDGRPVSVTISFRPKEVGARSAELVIESNSCDGATIRVALAGIGVLPDAVAIPQELDFGDRNLEQERREFLTIANQGGLRLQLQDLRIVAAVAASPSPSPAASPAASPTGSPEVDYDAEEILDPTEEVPPEAPRVDAAPFRLRSPPSLPRMLGPGESVDVVVSFRPTEAGPFEAVLRIRSNDPEKEVLEVPLRGRGVGPPPPASPTPAETPTEAPPPPSAGSGWSFPMGEFVPEILVGVAVLSFFALLVVLRRLRGIPE